MTFANPESTKMFSTLWLIMNHKSRQQKVQHINRLVKPVVNFTFKICKNVEVFVSGVQKELDCQWGGDKYSRLN